MKNTCIIKIGILASVIFFSLMLFPINSILAKDSRAKKTLSSAISLTSSEVRALGFGEKPFKKKKANVWTIPGGITIYSTYPYGSKIKGFVGPTPLFIAVNSKGKIISIAAGPNNEYLEYFSHLQQCGLLKKWNGMTLKKASTYTPDVVSGATYSSMAVIKTVKTTATKLSSK